MTRPFLRRCPFGCPLLNHLSNRMPDGSPASSSSREALRTEARTEADADEGGAPADDGALAENTAGDPATRPGRRGPAGRGGTALTLDRVLRFVLLVGAMAAVG